MVGEVGSMPWEMGQQRFAKDESDPATYARPDNDCPRGSDYTPAEVEFMLAMHGRQLAARRAGRELTCRDVLEVAGALGYRRAAEPRAWVTGEG
jgi:hypothetical protein